MNATKERCPVCGEEAAYVGFTSVKCLNRKCQNYVGEAVTIPVIDIKVKSIPPGSLVGVPTIDPKLDDFLLKRLSSSLGDAFFTNFHLRAMMAKISREKFNFKTSVDDICLRYEEIYMGKNNPTCGGTRGCTKTSYNPKESACQECYKDKERWVMDNKAGCTWQPRGSQFA
jgi:hypothetical protein